MPFYLLVFVVALTSFFGLIHSQTAREKLNVHLSNLHEWSVDTLHQQLRNLELVLAQYNARNNNNTINSHSRGGVRRNGTNDSNAATAQGSRSRTQRPADKSQSNGSIEEVEGIRLGRNQRAHPTLERIVLESEDSDYAQPARSEESLEERDKVLAAINASLRRLSRAAVSGRLNGAQLYDVLLQETRLHERAAAAVRANNGQLAAGSSGQQDEDVAPARMYFGESPLEYVPHHSS